MKNLSKLLILTAVAGLATGCVADAATYHSGPATVYSSTHYSRGNFYHDGSIHQRVHRALRRAPGVPADRIAVYVSNGNVYLRGTVFNYSQKNRAHFVAHSVAGVGRVFVNDLHVAQRRYW